MTKKEEKCESKGCCWHHKAGCGGIYGLGFLGALVYYLSTATSFWVGVLGVAKALLWPGFLVFEALKFLGA